MIREIIICKVENRIACHAKFTFQILGVFREIDIPRPPNEPLIRPDQRIRVNLLALMSPDSERLSHKSVTSSL